MECSVCGTIIESSSRVCAHCGTDVFTLTGNRCCSCHSPLVRSARFCHICGSPRPESNGSTPADSTVVPAEGDLGRLNPLNHLDQLYGEEAVHSERRTVTTLFADIVNSTGMAESLDPEDITAIMNRAFEVMAEPIARYDGTLARLMGDGMLCLFGAPRAHEDDAFRASRAALEITQNIKELSACLCQEYGLSSFLVRIGISTGLAVVGEVGTKFRSEYTAMGDAVNLAARLQHAAEPGTVLVCENTWRQVSEKMSGQRMGLLPIRGRTQPVNTFRLVASQPAGPLHTGNASFPQLIGRLGELKTLQTALERLNHGHGGIVIVSGKPGIGKSRLISEVRRSVSPRLTWTQAQCTEHTHSIAYSAARDILRELTGIGPEVRNDLIGRRVRRFIRSLDTVIPDHTPEITCKTLVSPRIALGAIVNHLLMSELQKREQQFINSLEGKERQEQLLVHACEFLRLSAHLKPIVVCWEDVHWIDSQSMDLVERLSRRLENIPLLFVLTHRPGATSISEMIDRIGSTSVESLVRLQLSPLSDVDSSRLLQTLVPAEFIQKDLLQAVIRSAEGNAFYLQEMLRTVMDQQSDGQAVANRGADRYAVPHSIQSAILSRVDRLPSRCKQVIRAASVIGHSFSADVLTKVLDPHLTLTGITGALAILQQREFITSADLATADSEGSPTDERESRHEFNFSHGLIQEVVYNSLLRTETRRLHHRVAEGLESLYADRLGELAVSLAHHYERADDSNRAITYLTMSAEQAADLGALDNAARAFRRALELMNRPGQDIPLEKQSAVRVGLGDVLSLSADYEQALEQYDLAVLLEKKPHCLAAIHRKRGRVLERCGLYDRSREAFEIAIDSMKDNLDEGEAGRVYAGLALVYYHRNELETATELARLALAMAEQTGDQRGVAQSCNNLGVICRRSGHLEQAREFLQKCLVILEEQGDQYGLAVCHNNIGLLDVEAKHWKNAAGHLEVSLSLFEAMNNRHGVARVHDGLGELFNVMGDSEKSQYHLEQAVTILSEIGRDSGGLLPEMWQSGMW